MLLNFIPLFSIYIVIETEREYNELIHCVLSYNSISCVGNFSGHRRVALGILIQRNLTAVEK